VVVTALGLVLERLPEGVRATVLERLAEAVTAHPSPGVRLRALMELARRSTAPLPVDADEVVGLMHEARAEARAAGHSSTRAGYPTASGVRDEWRDPMRADDVSLTLGDHVELRTALLVRLLADPDAWNRGTVLSAATDLVVGWRGDYRSLVEAVEALPTESGPEVAAAAAGFLEAVGDLASPGASIVSGSDTEGMGLDELLEDFEDYPTVEVARVLRDMGPAAAGAAPALRRELEQTRRHGLRAGEGIEPDGVGEDALLLRACAEALAAVTG
jgi:hypothetical protein